MRAFIAIPLPSEIKEALKNAQERLRESKAFVKWVKPENIHLTIKFLGEINDIQREKIALITREIAGKTNSFYAVIDSLGAFPEIKSPRIIWAGINEGKELIEKIAKEVEERTQALCVAQEDRGFSAHITLGRTKSGQNRKSLSSSLQEISVQPLKTQRFHVTKLTLFKSLLTPLGPVYEIIEEASLKTI